MPDFKKKIKLLSLVYLAILFFCLIFYSNTLHNPFIWDDEGLIVKNPLIRNWQFWYKAFTSDLYFETLAGSNFYRPIQTLSFMWDYHFWQLEPFGYHITNVFLQTIVSFLVFLFVYTLTRKAAIAFATSLLFALSPIHTEVVSYISGRADLFFSLFLLASLLLFIKAENSETTRKALFLFLSLLLFILGLLSKESAIVFPLVILALIFYFYRDNFKKPWYVTLVVIPFFVVDLVYIILRFTLLRFTTLWQPELTKYPALLRIAVLPKIFFTYAKILLMPVNLHMSRTLIRPVSQVGVFLSFLLLGIVFAGCIYILVYKKEKKMVSFLLFWFLVFLIPQSGIFPINAFVAEHFIYLASISFFIAVSYLLYRHLRGKLFIFSVTGLVFFYGTLTLGRNYEWRDPVNFYEHIIKFSPASFLAHNNLGVQYENRGRYYEAISEYKKALQIKPTSLQAHSNLANVYYKIGRFQDSEKEYKIVEQLAPYGKAGEVQNNIAALYEAQGLLAKALDRYKFALRLNPGLVFVHFNIARIYLAEGQPDLVRQEIIKSFPEIPPQAYKDKPLLKIVEEYLKQKRPLNCAATFYNDLGVKFAQARLFDEAIYSFAKAVELMPEYADAHFNLGLAYWGKKLKKNAINELKLALKINPNHNRARGLLRLLKKSKNRQQSLITEIIKRLQRFFSSIK